jgi:hypothetical protein
MHRLSGQLANSPLFSIKKRDGLEEVPFQWGLGLASVCCELMANAAACPLTARAEPAPSASAAGLLGLP